MVDTMPKEVDRHSRENLLERCDNPRLFANPKGLFSQQPARAVGFFD